MLEALSPLDGRYQSKIIELRSFLSEAALIRYRFRIEKEYLIALSIKLGFHKDDFPELEITDKDILYVKDIEKTTNHDVKAIEYLLRKKILDSSRKDLSEWIHFALTSQDINNTAFPLMIRDAWLEVMLPQILELIEKLNELGQDYASIPMLSHTHGQAASPSTVGKEIHVFRERLQIQVDSIAFIPFSAKFGGATGNFNAHHVAFPDIDWVEFADDFVMSLGLNRQTTTTQIEHYDQLGAFFHAISRINTILIDLSRDIWTYISMNYFGQKIKKGEVGSSTMPHKVNPIDFENAEGNLGIAIAIGNHLAGKLPVSRLQRDLTDSTVLRNVGVPLGHSLIAYKAILKGLGKLKINKEKIASDLENNWAVVTEAIQTILRREGVPNAYEKLKELSRIDGKIDKNAIQVFIDQLEIEESVKNEMRAISPHNYIGIQ